MREVQPSVRLIGRPSIDLGEIADYLDEVGGGSWIERIYGPGMGIEGPPDGEGLVEFAGRLCYRSWEPGLNANVTRIREDSATYLNNVLESGHGSVTEHAFYIFVFHNVSRVFTHELVRHRAGVSISQESMRFVRLTDIPMWHPEWALADPELMDRNRKLLAAMEEHQQWMADHFELDDPAVPFSTKKAKTSYMRRYAPDGVATSIVWGANIRTLRHVISMRTDSGAEEEIRLIFDDVAKHMQREAPNLFGDYARDETGRWGTEHWKV